MKARALFVLLTVVLALIAFPLINWPAGSAEASSGNLTASGQASAARPTKTPTRPGTATPTNSPARTKVPKATETPTQAPTHTTVPAATATPLPTADTPIPADTPSPTATTVPAEPTPARPVASAAQAKQNLLNYINSVRGNQILSGQQEAEWVDGLSQDLNYIRATTGKSPAIRGFESQLTPNTNVAEDPTDISIAAWRDEDFIIQWSWHMGAPIAGDDPIVTDDYNHSQLTVDLSAVLTAGTPENANFLAKLDAQAARLERLRDSGIPVLWRPFHEMNGNWFWWSKGGGEAYKQLWTYTYDYFTNTKQLDNLIWVWSTIRGPEYLVGHPPGTSFYPGDEYVDIVGGDLYSGYTSFDWARFTDAYAGFSRVAPNKVAAITEASAIPDPVELLQTRGLHYVWFLPWYGSHVKANPPDYLAYVYNSAYTITLDELPDLKSAP